MTKPTSISSRQGSSHFDLVGIGFGPSNLALAAALEEEGEALCGRRLSGLFLDRRDAFTWHPGLLLDGARIQLNFLKDLVTLRNPCSRFTFLNYLRERGRLDEFINLRNFFPTRLEFNDYYRWASGKLAHWARFGTEVEALAPVTGADGTVEAVEVHGRDRETGEPLVYRAANLVVATGGEPSYPEGIDPFTSRRAFHTVEFLPRLNEQFADRDREWRFVIVGSGQTAAEVFQYLYTHYPNARVTAALRRFAYKPADDSHFVNEIFFPRMVDLLYGLPPEKRELVLEAHMDTNYSCVDLDLIQEIYEELYQRRVAGDDRLQILNFLEIKGLADQSDHTAAEFQDVVRDRTVSLPADGVFLATGYRRSRRHPILAGIDRFLVARDDAYVVDRSFRVETSPDFTVGVFLQGFSQDTHGLSDTLLSTLPLRSAEILRALEAGPVAPLAALATTA